MTRLERYQKKLEKLKQKEKELFRSGKYVQSMALKKDIDEIQSMIEEQRKYYEPRPILDFMSREEIDKMGIIPLIVEAHLVADFLTEICYMVVDICKSHGLSEVSFVPEIKDILKKSDRFASFLSGMEGNLPELLARNETFNASLHKKYQNYIITRMKHSNKK